MRKLLLGASIVAGVGLVAVPAVLIAHPGIRGSALDRQTFKYREREASTSSKAWSNVPGVGVFQVCAINEVSANVNLVLRGGPVAFRIRIDGTSEVLAHPGAVSFRPGPGRVFSFGFAEHVAPFEANDLHQLELQWRSLTGRQVTLKRGMVNVLFERGLQGPACAV
jgi:hypothetical protein